MEEEEAPPSGSIFKNTTSYTSNSYENRALFVFSFVDSFPLAEDLTAQI